ncbi:MAG TPA: hypothetical protein VEQ60_32540 [Longimicrobium sp.]|nr:hypothetical protein [Longimicrobium sp.]
MDFTLELSKEVLNVKVLVIEGINCLNSIQPTGSQWILRLPELQVAADGDIDIFAFVEGMPKTRCAMRVTVDDTKPKVFDNNVFNRHGNTFFNVAVPLSKLEATNA